MTSSRQSGPSLTLKISLSLQKEQHMQQLPSQTCNLLYMVGQLQEIRDYSKTNSTSLTLEKSKSSFIQSYLENN